MKKKLKIHPRVYAIRDGGRPLPLACRYIDGVNFVSRFEDISWFSILSRSIRLVELPDKSSIKTWCSSLKRKVAKLLKLNLKINRVVSEFNFEECLVEDHGEKVFLISSSTILPIYQTNLPEDFVCLQLKDEFREWHTKKIIEKSKKGRELGILDEKPGLTVFINLHHEDLIRAYRRIHPKRHIVVRYHDGLDGELGANAPDVSTIRRMIVKLTKEGVVNEVESYCRRDAAFLNAVYRPNGVNSQVMRALCLPQASALYTFVGTPKDISDFSRLKDLSLVRKTLEESYPEIGSWIDERLIVSVRDWISYDAYLKMAASNEVVVDMVRHSQEEGFSFRIAEALFWNKKIITNRKIILDEPFYSPERVFLLGFDSLERLKPFLEAELSPLSPDILKYYDSSLWWTDKDPYRRTSINSESNLLS